jgi:Uma2 family endonuclease
MTDGHENLPVTKSEYLAWEREQMEKHEYHLGKIVPYGSRGPRHNCLTVGVITEIHVALRGRECFPFAPGQRISIANGQYYVYPDVSVVCGALRSEVGTTDVLENPMVIVEVLSASTEKFDRGDKWAAYQKIESLKDYLLVSQSTARIEHYQRQADGSWRYTVAESGGSITLSNEARLSVDDIYAGAFAIPGEE